MLRYIEIKLYTCKCLKINLLPPLISLTWLYIGSTVEATYVYNIPESTVTPVSMKKFFPF